jgi:hypothetical protein
VCSCRCCSSQRSTRCVFIGYSPGRNGAKLLPLILPIAPAPTTPLASPRRYYSDTRMRRPLLHRRLIAYRVPGFSGAYSLRSTPTPPPPRSIPTVFGNSPRAARISTQRLRLFTNEFKPPMLSHFEPTFASYYAISLYCTLYRRHARPFVMNPLFVRRASCQFPQAEIPNEHYTFSLTFVDLDTRVLRASLTKLFYYFNPLPLFTLYKVQARCEYLRLVEL